MAIIGILLKSSLLLIAAGLVHVVLRKRVSAASRHLLWTLAICGLLALPVFSGMLPAWTLGSASSRAAQLTRTAESQVARLTVEVPSVGARLRPSDGGADDRAIPWPTIAAVVYGIGVLLLLFRLAVQRWSVRRLAHRAAKVADSAWTELLAETAASLGLRRPVLLLRVPEETMPMAFGIVRPAIVIPAVSETWSEDRRRSVLLHELAHVARHDCLTQSLAAVACAIYWIHPGVWWIARRLRIERELACDDRVLSAGADADAYASHLLDLAYSLRVDIAPSLAVTMAAARQLEARLRALLDSGLNRRAPARRSLLAATAITLTLAGSLSAARISAAPLLQIESPPRQAFAVASVKPNKSVETGGFIQRRPGGHFSVRNQTLQTLILFAYQLQRFQLVGAPGWVATERFEVVAKAATDVPPTMFGQIPPEALMLRSLLEDRFRLSVHRETRELPIYALVLARADGRLGPQLRRPTSDFCARQFEAAGKPGFTPPPEGSPVCGITGDGNGLTAGSLPMSEFARFLSGPTRRIVVDRTGLTGGWDFNLKFSPPDAPSPDPDRPSIFTALQEQLGLRLEATTGPVDVLVIDRVEPLIPD